MNTQTKEAISKLLKLEEECNKPENKDDMELMDNYWQQVRVVAYNLLCELYEDRTAEELLASVFKPDEKST